MLSKLLLLVSVTFLNSAHLTKGLDQSCVDVAGGAVSLTGCICSPGFVPCPKETTASCTFSSGLDSNNVAFSAANNPCTADDCNPTHCSCKMQHGDSHTVSPNECIDSASFSVTDTKGNCVLRESQVTGMVVSCNNGVLTAGNFIAGQANITNVALIQCPIFGNNNLVCP